MRPSSIGSIGDVTSTTPRHNPRQSSISSIGQVMGLTTSSRSPKQSEFAIHTAERLRTESLRLADIALAQREKWEDRYYSTMDNLRTEFLRRLDNGETETQLGSLRQDAVNRGVKVVDADNVMKYCLAYFKWKQWLKQHGLPEPAS